MTDPYLRDGNLPVQPQLNALAGLESWTDWWARRSRSLFLFDEVGGGSLRRQTEVQFIPAVSIEFLISCLCMLDQESHEPIWLHINSPGGNIVGGLALIQVMRHIQSPVHTLVHAEAASMAAVIAVAGDRRFAYPLARWLLHRGKSQPPAGDADDIAIAQKELKVRDGQADLVVVNHTKIPPEKLKRMQVKDKWFGTPQAVKWGLVDEVIQPSKGPNNWLPNKAFLKSIHETEEEEEEETGGETQP